MRAVDLHSRYLSKNFGLTGPQLIVLRQLSLQPEISSGELAKTISLSQATITGITDRLGKRELITKRKSDVDKRRIILSLTEEGKKLLTLAPPPLQESFLRQFETLQDWERTMILSSLQRLVGMVDAKDIDTGPILTNSAMDSPPKN